MRNKITGLILPIVTILTVAICCGTFGVGGIAQSFSPCLSYSRSVAIQGQSVHHHVAEQTMSEQVSTDEVAPNDEYFDKQWALIKIQASEEWTSASDSGVLIAVLDTGIDESHEDLDGKVVASINFSGSPTADDLHGHGTHIGGIIAATANNGIGIAGLDSGCSLLSVKVADDTGLCNAASVAQGIIWAVDNGATVINMSLTITEPSKVLEQAVEYAWNKGAILVAAAGNNGVSTSVYPANYSQCISVTATKEDDTLAKLANHGYWIDLAAPGVAIYSTLPGNTYGFKSGTSMATAYVAGLAGLLFPLASDTNGNGLVNDEVRNAIESSCDETGILNVAMGRINVAIAMKTIEKQNHGEDGGQNE